MAKSRNENQTRIFQQLIAKLEPDLQKAFLAAVADLRKGINWEALIAALKANDIEAAIAALQIDAAAFAALHEAHGAAFRAGGVAAALTINPPAGGKIIFRFDMTNPRAEEWIRQQSSTMIVRVSEEAKEAARQVIREGYARGAHPNSIALDLGGRIEGGRRSGGIIGLSPDLVKHVDSMRNRLDSGSKQDLERIKGMTRRDKRFDKYLNAAIDKGASIPKDIMRQMLERYEDRLKAYRAERIARTETGFAVMAGRREEWAQAAEKLGYDPTQSVEKTWVHGGGVKDPRPEHMALNGITVVGLETDFPTVGMRHALDPRGGPKQCVNCTCDTVYKMDHTAGLT